MDGLAGDRPDTARPQRAILIFVDGIGWGDEDPARNPLLSYGGELLRLGGEPTSPRPHAASGWARGIDAQLGVPGLPQSATGQTSLFTGRNAQARLGKHLTGFPNDVLRELLREHSLLRLATLQGRRAAFMNAYRPLFFVLSTEQQWRLSASTVANLAAGLPFFTLDDLHAGRAVYQEFTNRELRWRGFTVPEWTPVQAGVRLATAAAPYELALYEYFQTDRAGHAADRARSEAELAGLDAFLAALLREEAARGPHQALVVLSSDHGNIEDLTTPRHTANPVPLLAWGPGARELVEAVERISDVAPALLAAIRKPPAA
ncbi:MAG: peptidase [Candidatus Krumholzibacteriia bacterium]